MCKWIIENRQSNFLLAHWIYKDYTKKKTALRWGISYVLVRDNGNFKMGRKLHSYCYHCLFRKMRNSVLIFLKIPSWFFSCSQNCKFRKASQSVQLLSCVRLFATHGRQHTRLPCPSPAPGAYSNSCPLSRWCHPTISSSVVPFSSCPQSFPPSGSFQTSQFFASSGQSIGVSASASVLPGNIQDWFPLGWTGWISLQSTGLSKSLLQHHSSKHQFFSTQLSL